MVNTRHAGDERARYHASGRTYLHGRAQETFLPLLFGLSPPRAGPWLFFFRVWAVCFLTPGAPRLCGGRLCACACGRLLRARGRGWVACSLPFSLLAVRAPCCFLLLGLLAVPPLPRARVALGLLVGASPPARCAGGCSRRAGFPLPGLSSPGVTQHYNKKVTQKKKCSDI